MNNSRILIIDSLRGYALMGLFLIHMVEYYELYWLQPEPSLVNTVMFALFGGKAYAIFALLFGLSFFIIMDRQAARGVDFRPRFVWRLVVLYLLGFFHTLIYGGDILQILAVCGLILVPLWKLGSRWILLIALLLLAQTPMLGFVAYLAQHPEISYQQPFFVGFQVPVFAAYAHGSLADVVLANAWNGQAVKWCFSWESGRLANITGISMLGFLLGRIGFFTQKEQYQRTYVFGWVLSLLLALGLYFSRDLFLIIPHTDSATGLLMGMHSMYFNLMLTFLSILSFVLLYHWSPLHRLLKLLAPAGRMSLTQYIGQSLLFVPFYYGFGAGAYAYIGQTHALLLGLVSWAALVAAAHLWFRHLRMGPFEWCWRAATYLRRDIPFKGAPTNE